MDSTVNYIYKCTLYIEYGIMCVYIYTHSTVIRIPLLNLKKLLISSHSNLFSIIFCFHINEKILYETARDKMYRLLLKA